MTHRTNKHNNGQMSLFVPETSSLPVVNVPIIKRPAIITRDSCTGDKVKVFMACFDGRHDVYAKHWESYKTGLGGYSPQCSNLYKPNVCPKTMVAKGVKVSCVGCQFSSFKAFTEDVAYDHLMGRGDTLGVYPIVHGVETHFLALDFDKSDWELSVKFVSLACDDLNVPHIIERSRSGNGAHLWVFFSEAVLAKDARLLGEGLLHRAITEYPVALSSFDRMIPNQDFVPEGKLGNLIALPLFLQSMRQGNSIFIDNTMRAFDDQWLALSSVVRISSIELASFLEVLAPDIAAHSHNEWDDLPDIKSNKGGKIQGVLADKLYLPLATLSPSLKSALRRALSFSNPDFYMRLRAGRKTFGVPRYFDSTFNDGKNFVIPAGALDRVKQVMADSGWAFSFKDERFAGKKIPMTFTGELLSEQILAVSAMLPHDFGVLEGRTSFGKTVTAIAMIVERGVNALIVVHTKTIARQFLKALDKFLDGVEVGSLLNGKDKLTGMVDVATYQGLVGRNGDVKPLIHDYGNVVVDECHMVGADNYYKLLCAFRGKFRLGMSATLDRRDGKQPRIYYALGDSRFTSAKQNSSLYKSVFVRHTGVMVSGAFDSSNINELYDVLVQSELRNNHIIEDVLAELIEGRHPMIVSERREHIAVLSELLISRGVNVITLMGGMKDEEFDLAMERLEYPAPNTVVLTTGRFGGAGFDIQWLDSLFLTLPVSWQGMIKQYVGRLHREFDNKKFVKVFDYVDDIDRCHTMFKKRATVYRKEGYVVGV